MNVFMPESHRYLAKKKKDDQVLTVLKRIYKAGEAQVQLQLLQK